MLSPPLCKQGVRGSSPLGSTPGQSEALYQSGEGLCRVTCNSSVSPYPRRGRGRHRAGTSSASWPPNEDGESGGLGAAGCRSTRRKRPGRCCPTLV